MIYDSQTLNKCSIEQLEQYEKEHKKEMQNLINEWFAIDHMKLVWKREIVDYDWKVKSASLRLKNIQIALKNKYEMD